MNQDNPLGREKISRLIMQYSIPAIIGMTVNAFYNIVDRIFIGNSPDLGADGLAGITVTFPLMIIILGLGILFGIGGATLYSLRLGEGKTREAEAAVSHSFLLLTGAGLLLMIFGQIFMEPLLRIFGASDTVLPYASEYLRVILFGAVFQMVSIGFNHFIRADGSPRFAMLVMFVGAGLNIILDPILIFGLNMGMRGAALATVIAQGCAFVCVIYYYNSRFCHSRLRLKGLRLEFHLVRQITVLGMPGFLLQLATSLLSIILNRSLYIYGGDIALSAMGIIHSLSTIFILPVIGIRQGVQPIISFNYGAGRYNRVRQTVIQATLYCTLTLIAGFLVIRLFPTQLIGMFNRETELLVFGRQAMMTWFLCLPLVGVQIMGSSYFQAIGKAGVATLLTLTRQVILLIPALLIFPLYWGIQGLLFAAPFADLFSGLITSFCLIYSLRRLQEPRLAAKADQPNCSSST